ncbi:MAG: S1C family serine protease [Clostridia bacterium]|nr:S1C family serine protease [Clostridia bacterium]
MKRKTLKGLIATVAAGAVFTASALFGGCFAGKDGKDGKDLTIYDILEAAREIPGNEDLTLDELLQKYLSYTPQEIEEQISFQKTINQSLLSAVYVYMDVNEMKDGHMVTQAYSGSGVIIDMDKTAGDMTVLTNCHVIYSAKAKTHGADGYSDNILLWTYGTELYRDSAMKAEIMCASITYDLALLKVTASNVVKNSNAKPVSWTKAEENFLGETVYTIGNPKSMKLSVSTGYISRDLQTYPVDMNNDPSVIEEYNYDVMRLAMGVNSGNSGGGLFNHSGQLIGVMNARGASTDPTNPTLDVAYALPAARVRRVVSRMLDDYTGVETHSFSRVKWEDMLGLELYNASTSINDDGLVEIEEIVKVTSADMGTPFSKFIVGDVLNHITVTRGGEVIEDLDITRKHNFTDAMISVKAGDLVTVTVLRGGNPRELTMTFAQSHFTTEV